MSNSANIRLIRSTGIYFIGTFVSRLLQFFILPIITAIMTPEEYGTYDLIIVSSGLILPLVTLQVAEALFRFLFNSDKKYKKIIISTVTSLMMLGVLILSLLIIIENKFIGKLQYSNFIIMYFVTQSILLLYQKVARSLRKNKVFALSGIIQTFVLLITQIILITKLGFRVNGLLLGNIFSNIVCIIYLESRIRILKYIDIKSISFKSIKEVITFSLPLIPNSISYWLMNSANKYIIGITLGITANGIYAISNKFPALLTTATGVFHMAWQETSIIEENSKNKDDFNTNIFNAFMIFVISSVLVLLPLIKIFIPIIIDSKYSEGKLYIPILIFTSVFNAFSGFYGSAYITYKKTIGALWTTIIGTIINISITYILISKIGLFAPAIGSCLAFLIVWIIRVISLKKIFNPRINKSKLFKLLFLSFIIIGIYYIDSIMIQIITCITMIISWFILNRELVFTFIRSKKTR